MNKESFLKELAFLLQDISEEDREDAIAYYEDYFLEAGTENESTVLAELQSPERVAALIKAGLHAQFEETIEYSESSMGNRSYDRQHDIVIPTYEEKEESRSRSKKDENETRKETRFQGDRDRNRILLYVIIAFALIVFGAPIFGVGFGIIAAVIAIIFSLGIVFVSVGIAALLSAIVVLVKSIMHIAFYPGAGAIGIGVSMILFAISFFMLKNMKWPFVLIPTIVKNIIEIVKNIIAKVGEKYETYK